MPEAATMIIARPDNSFANGNGIGQYDDPIGKTEFTTKSETEGAVLETPLGKLGESTKTVMTETSSSSSSESNGHETQTSTDPVPQETNQSSAPESNGSLPGKGGAPSARASTSGPRGPMGVSPVPNSFLLIPTNNVSKVIKGEIHNLVATLRGDSRYVAPLRFVEEVPSDEHHPLLTQMKDLYASMTEFEMTHHALSAPEPRVYLPPFCAAVTNRDISASVTGVALNALHKFLMFGFFGTATATGSGPAQTGADGKAFATIANALLNCTFEESSSGATPGPPGAPVAVSSDRGLQAAPGRTANETNGAGSTSTREDEDVVLKLLELCALVVRSASRILATDLIVGLLDTCLHVSHRAQRASHLLKCAAESALSQILIEVFCPIRVPAGADGQTPPSRRLSPAREPVLIKLVELLNPNQPHPPSDEGVVSSLNLITVALETLPDALSKSEVALLKNSLCQYLLHWTLSEDLTIMSLTLRIFFNLFQRQRNQLKGALEVFLASVHLRILEHSKSPEVKEIVLENLVEYIKEPGLMKDFFLNYDCDIQCTNVFESICTTLGNIAAPSGFMKGGAPTAAISGSGPPGSMASAIAMKAAAAAAEVPVSALTSLALEGLLAILDSISRRIGKSSSPSETASEGEDTAKQRNHASEEQLQRRRQKKMALSKVAMAFNRNPDGEEWLKIGKDIKVLDGSPQSVAKMLFSAPGLDKDVVGSYLSKGPPEAYPFEQQVRTAFAEQCHFSKFMNFASSLRLFLSKFRMPGEAQCIDRFMEAFSKELYRQQGDTSIFKNSDAIFVLAFSTIMLNTDLHNPTLKNVNRMTVDQFVRNNRGINDGFDLPEDMLRELYEQIKHSEIQVQREVVDFMTGPDGAAGEDFASAWENVLSKNVAAPIFSSIDEGRKNQNQAGLLEKEMFLCLAKPSLKTLCSTFVRSWDDTTVVDTLKGFEQLAKASTIFGIDKLLNEILKFLLSHGRDYIVGCVTLEYAGIEAGAPINQDPNDDETMSIVDLDSPVPHVILKAREVAMIDPRRVDVAGAAAYRGLLVLNMALKMVRALFPKVRDAWPQLIEVLCALRDARALPAGLADLDDFADSSGNVLPLSWFSQESSRRLERHYKSKTEKEQPEETGWFRLNIFASKEEKEKNKPTEEFVTSRGELSANAKMLLQIAEKTEVQVFTLFGPKTRLPILKHSIMRLLEAVDQWPKTDSPVYEQNTAFALELATRALLANKDRATELFPLFLTKFENIAAKIKENQESLASVPFLVERVVVTILRSSIHLYSNPEVRNFLEMLKALIQLCNCLNCFVSTLGPAQVAQIAGSAFGASR